MSPTLIYCVSGFNLLSLPVLELDQTLPRQGHAGVEWKCCFRTGSSGRVFWVVTIEWIPGSDGWLSASSWWVRHNHWKYISNIHILSSIRYVNILCLKSSCWQNGEIVHESILLLTEQATQGQTTLLVVTGGTVKFEGNKLRFFNQNFLLTAQATPNSDQPVWKIASDCFRFQDWNSWACNYGLICNICFCNKMKTVYKMSFIVFKWWTSQVDTMK